METTTESTPASVRPNGHGVEPVGASGNAWLELAKFLAGPLEYLTQLRERDDRPLIPFQPGKQPCYLVTHPEYVRHGRHNEDWPPISQGRRGHIRTWVTQGMFVAGYP